MLISSLCLFRLTEHVMRIIKVATDDGNAYYDIVSRLKRTHLRFSSLSPGQAVDSVQDLVITSKREVPAFRGNALAIEDLNQDPLVMEGQLLSRLLDESRRDLLIGIDPGSRIGVVVFYGGKELGAMTTNSVDGLADFVDRSREGGASFVALGQDRRRRTQVLFAIGSPAA